ncbi:class I SAM-dependent RNA methyltransferase [Actinotalea fermentans]|uniref:23S rRNA methyltransferase n=1 Tax=Actinotalea fermentans TaxID=43671 RepID=A0A511YU75_9CELL|nr:TRAM domain-containing protein [Actinotalea fermentans]KGM17019.1 SAM-dependent methyltransferase [Actinotalea fermentans ATCC 43279 = JCM 9966 = DSM 3133]GEN78741.1 23S rRNA methyltransferase [Actinotalea fermentans]
MTQAGDADVVVLEVGAVAHGGHCVARHEGRVVFVRHALPGERVEARLTERGESARFWRADAVRVLDASPDRVASPWPEAGPGGVGGGELGHVALPAQRAWKAAVVAEQLRRLARDERDVVVEAVPGETDGLGWRTRIELTVDARGRAGMHRYRSADVLPLTDMPLAVPALRELGLFDRRWPASARLTAVAPVGGDRPLVLVDGVPWAGSGPDRRPNARTSVREVADVAGSTHTWRVAADGFWQVHRAAPTVLAQAVVDAVGAVPGATVVDLYAGAGLFTVPLAGLVGEQGRVVAVEGDVRAVKDARRNAHDAPWVDLHLGPVADVLRDGAVARADVVVLDPPRVGAGRAVVDRVAALGADRVVYVACDPAALARDVAYLRGRGYALTGLRAFDIFPMTHHVECVAVFTREA